MKYILTIILLIVLFSGGKISAAKNDSDKTPSVLLVQGSIGNLVMKKNNHYTVELICYNKVLKTVKLKDKDDFRFMLKRDVHYAIRITKKGFAPRLISIHTTLPEDDKRLHRFYFDTELISLKEARILDKDAIDFPIAVVSFDKELGSFYYNEDYTAGIKRQLYTGQQF